jgi:inorganic pyrophosphatase
VLSLQNGHDNGMSIDWTHWEQLITARGITIDRPRGTDHPRYTGWTYPLDYGFIPETKGGDGHPVDVFVGTALTGLQHAMLVRHDNVEEIKLLWNLSRAEIDTVEKFLSRLPYVQRIDRSISSEFS